MINKLRSIKHILYVRLCGETAYRQAGMNSLVPLVCRRHEIKISLGRKMCLRNYATKHMLPINNHVRNNAKIEKEYISYQCGF